MKEKRWTYRAGEITSKDKAAIRGLTEINMAASQIFITGEVLCSRIGEVACVALLHANTMVDEPLFVLTDEKTMRMTRFDAREVWPTVGGDSMDKMVAKECEHFGVPGFFPTVFDFYESLFKQGGLSGTFTPKQDTNNAYLNALTVFGKSLLFDIPASLFFSARFPGPCLVNTMVQPLSKDQLTERDVVWDKTSTRLTNDEIEFLSHL
jgi:hypothetical protein